MARAVSQFVVLLRGPACQRGYYAACSVLVPLCPACAGGRRQCADDALL